VGQSAVFSQGFTVIAGEDNQRIFQIDGAEQIVY
jgi:hypothetical protein